MLIAGMAAMMFAPVQAQSMMGLPKVLAELEGVEYVGKARPKKDAKVYFIYHSRKACTVCVAEMPDINKTYKRMKGKGAEIVMLNQDKDLETAEKWVKDAKIQFPVVAPGQRHSIPFPFDFSVRGMLPLAVAVTEDGEKLGQANGADVAEFFDKNWRKYLAQVRKEERKKASKKKSKKKKKKSDSFDMDEEE